jgi:hypothetical protein
VLKLYVDGVLNATATGDLGLKSTPFASFGRIEDTSGAIDYLAGSLDEIRVYNRVLSDAEVRTVRDAGVPQPTAVTYVSDLPYQVISNGYGPAERDTSNGERPAGDGKTITLNGTTYAKGLGVHANSEIVVNLNGQYATFVSDVGIDDEVGSLGSVIFQVYLDDVKVFDSGVMTGSSATKTVSVDVTGHNKLQLIVDQNGDGDSDHADWAGARLLSTAAAGGGSTTVMSLTVKAPTPLPVTTTTTTTTAKKQTPTPKPPVTATPVGLTKTKIAPKPAPVKKK